MDQPLNPYVENIGFGIVTKMKSLGIVLDNKCVHLYNHFNSVRDKITQLINQWGWLNLSLPGRIAISKTMLISQISYEATILRPSRIQVTELKDLIDGFVTNGIEIAKDRLYTKPKHGELGLIELQSFCDALKCSWVKRCLLKINDSWRWILEESCQFNFDNLDPGDINIELYPVHHSIKVSYIKLKNIYWMLHENFKTTQLVDNNLFSTCRTRSRQPLPGIVDGTLLG